METIDERLSQTAVHRLGERAGPTLSLVLSLTVFGLAQYRFLTAGWDGATYLALTFGSLAFVVISFYLPELLKLKVAGIELEKSAVDQTRMSASLGLKR